MDIKQQFCNAESLGQNRAYLYTIKRGRIEKKGFVDTLLAKIQSFSEKYRKNQLENLEMKIIASCESEFVNLKDFQPKLQERIHQISMKHFPNLAKTQLEKAREAFEEGTGKKAPKNLSPTDLEKFKNEIIAKYQEDLREQADHLILDSDRKAVESTIQLVKGKKDYLELKKAIHQIRVHGLASIIPPAFVFDGKKGEELKAYIQNLTLNDENELSKIEKNLGIESVEKEDDYDIVEAPLFTLSEKGKFIENYFPLIGITITSNPESFIDIFKDDERFTKEILHPICYHIARNGNPQYSLEDMQSAFRRDMKRLCAVLRLSGKKNTFLREFNKLTINTEPEKAPELLQTALDIVNKIPIVNITIDKEHVAERFAEIKIAREAIKGIL